MPSSVETDLSAIESKDFGTYWYLVQKFYHEKFFNSDYLGSLIAYLDKLQPARVLDASCGIGYPAIELAQHGFNITCSDGDESLLRVFEKRLRESDVAIPIHHARWAELPEKIDGTFPIVLCLDSSITYANSWGSEGEINLPQTREEIRKSLQGFYDMLEPGGKAVIGLGEYAFTDDRVEGKIVDLGTQAIGGQTVQLVWKLEFDYEQKKKTWHSVFTTNGREYTRTFYSYMLMADELEELLREVGFTAIETEPTPGGYDRNVIATK